jgi:hypothetical protein
MRRTAGGFLKQPDLIPDKGQFRSRFHHRLSYGCPATIFRDILAALFGRLRAVKGHRMTDAAHNQHSETRRPSDRTAS